MLQTKIILLVHGSYVFCSSFGSQNTQQSSAWEAEEMQADVTNA